VTRRETAKASSTPEKGSERVVGLPWEENWCWQKLSKHLLLASSYRAWRRWYLGETEAERDFKVSLSNLKA
jgi:hypothetical protein